MKQLLLRILALLAGAVIARHRPFVVGITGTVGKSTSTHFIADFLSSRFPGQVMVSEHNYNGEF